MKALLIGSVLLFSLRAMSADVGEEQKSPCPYADQGKREAKVIDEPAKDSEDKKPEVKAIAV